MADAVVAKVASTPRGGVRVALKKDSAPPGYQTESQFKSSMMGAHYTEGQPSNIRFHRLFDERVGCFGDRPGNSWGVRRRQWIEKYLLVQDKLTGEMVRFKLNEAQRKLEREIVRLERMGVPVRIAILKARQLGFSTYIAACLLWFTLTHTNSRGLIMAHKEKVSKVIHGRIKDMARLMQRTDGKKWNIVMKASNRAELVFDGPIFGQIGVDSAESQDFVGDTIRFLHKSETPKWKNAVDKAGKIHSMVPQRKGTYIFDEATAEGDTGYFADLWSDAWKEQQNPTHEAEIRGFATMALFFPWFGHEGYRWSSVFDRPLTDKIRKEIEKTISSEEQWLLDQQYLRRFHGWKRVDADQLAWRRWCIKEICHGDLALFNQEYPGKPEDAFRASGMKFFAADIIAEYRKKYATAPDWKGHLEDPKRDAAMTRAVPFPEAV